MVVCPNCGHQSAARFFCDRCRALLPPSAQAVLPARVTLADGRLVDCAGFNGAFPAEPWHPLDSTAGGAPVRVYALGRSWWSDLAATVERRAATTLDVLAPLDILPVADGAIVVAHSLPDAHHPLLRPQPDVEWPRLDDTLAACRLLERALTPLHEAGFVWLNFDPAALLTADGRVQVQALDLALYSAATTWSGGVRLSSAYAPPEVCAFRTDRIGRATDVFHVALYAYYRLAGLLPGGFPGAGLEAFDFAIPPLRVYAPTLPPGIAPVVARGLARDPIDRFATVAEFVAAFSEAVAEAHARAAENRPVRIDSAGATAIGRTHVVMGLPNQDSHAIVPSGDAVLAIVADGVTTASVGRGEKASRIAIEVLTERLAGAATEADLPAAITAACLQASAAILDAALAEVPPGVTVEPYEMMSTTVVVAVARGGEVVIGCAGDSRAYLIANGQAEQLTVDGDVNGVHLAAGWSPEQMRDLGADASALYSCLGFGEPGADGRWAPSADRCSPRVRRWRLRPGDVVVLCSDGLVEEGVFLEPREVALIAARHDSAQELANALVAAAVERHHDPSPWEPEGRGDDVTCVVLKVRGRDE